MCHLLRCPYLLIFFFISIISSRLYAYIPSEGNVTASYGPFLYKTNFEGSNELSSSPILGDFGFITDGDLSDKSSLEIGLFHMNKIYYRNLDTRYLVEKTELIHITMGYKRWYSETISFFVGFYAAYSIGDYQIMHSDSNVHLEIDTSARDTTEYGLDFALQKELWAKNGEAITLDLRYANSISNKDNEHGDHFGLFLAFRHIIQEKNKKGIE